MSFAEDAVIDVVGAQQVSDYKLRLTFNDGKERMVDFEPFLRSSRNPMIRAYLEASNFRNFRVEYGDLIWDDYGLCSRQPTSTRTESDCLEFAF